MKKSDSGIDLVKISELARLSGVPTPTIKYYMSEGLLPEPALRTSRNMAYYDPILSGRVRAIKDLQQTHFLPLKVIGELLEKAPSAKLRSDLNDEMRRKVGQMGPAIHDAQSEVRQQRAGAGEATQRTRADVLENIEVTEDDLKLLADLGLARESEGDQDEAHYTGADLDILEIIGETRKRGLGDLFPMDILEPYTEAIRNLVRLELDLFKKRVIEGAQLPADQELGDVTKVAVQLSERLVTAMRSKLIFNELHTIMSGDGEGAG